MGGAKMLLLLVMMLALMSAKLCRIDAQNTKELPGTRICNSKYVSGIAENRAVDAAVDRVVALTSGPNYHLKTKVVSQVGTQKGTAWAIGACYGKLSKSQCNKCMLAARKKLQGYCNRESAKTGNAKGAQIKLQDCRLRWELYEFDW